MIRQIFNPDNYFFNIFALPYFLVGILVFLEGFFVFFQEKKSRLHITYSLTSTVAGIWLTAVGFLISSSNEIVALIWGRYFSWFGIIFVTPAVYLFSSIWEEGILSRRKKIIVSANFLSAFIFYITCIYSNYLIKGIWSYPNGLFPKAGSSEWIFILWFYSVMVSSFHNFIKSYRKEEAPIKKKHTLLVIVAFSIAFLGSVEFLANYGIPVFPIACFPLLLFLSVIGYSIIRYKLMDIETVIHKTLMWLVASSVVSVPIVLLSYWLCPWYREASSIKVAVLCAAVFYFLTLYLKLIQPKIDHFFQRRKYDLERASEKFTMDLVHLKSPAELIKKIEDTIKDTLYSEKISIIMEIPKDGQFLNWLSKNDALVYRDFVELDPEYEPIRNQARDYFTKTEAMLIIPLVLDKRLLGIINLGKKSNLKRYSTYDFQFLKRLKNEATIALSNSLLYGRVEEEVKIRTDELIQTQKQLIQAEKLATVGTLAGGVAHEINNPLAAVLTNAQMLLMEAKTEDEKESLQLIEQAAKRCREIVQKLMVYSRKPLGGREIKEFNLENGLNNVLSFLEYQFNQDNIKITTNLQNPPFLIKGSQTELEQVFTNLILNAKDAIKHGKKQGNIDISIAKHNDKITIKVKDDGAGISREHLLKIFDPFFTTKDAGKGTGLGLSICQSIVEQHNGTIIVESEVGKGSTFTIILPTNWYRENVSI